MGTDILTDTLWDVVICGTGLPQSLLALSLSRSGKNILHIDANDYYGGAEAALTLQDAENWETRQAIQDAQVSRRFTFLSITKSGASTSLSTRAYSLALAPQLVHARSELLSQLVSSKAARQIDFLAVGSFYILRPSSDLALIRIPSTREDVFATTALSMKAKRILMKFLKFVMSYDSSEHVDSWKPHEEIPLSGYLEDQFKMEPELRSFILALTLSLDAKIPTKDGLSIIHRHLTSMGVFGPGFAAVYPKWGGLAEIAQVACRSGAVGGAVYMLGTDIKATTTVDAGLELELSSGDKVKTRLVVRGGEGPEKAPAISRLVAVVGSPLQSLFTPTVEGAPIPAVAVIALPAGSLTVADEEVFDSPVYLFVHSSDTGECPSGQSVLYLTTSQTSDSKEALTLALEAFLKSVDEVEAAASQVLYQLYYEQTDGGGSSDTQLLHDDLTISLPSPTASSLAFDDSVLDPVRDIWTRITGETTEYMVFPEREGTIDDADATTYE